MLNNLRKYLVLGDIFKKTYNIIPFMVKYKTLFTLISVLFIMVGIILLYLSNDYSPILTNIKLLDENGKIIYKPDYKIEFNGYILNIIGETIIGLGVSILSIFFISELLTQQDRKNFENKLEEFQKKTAESAVLSIFDTLIDDSFYSIIRRDVIGLTLIRKNVSWIYIISNSNNDTVTLKRVITYDLYNLTSSKQSDIIKTAIGSNKHSSTTKHEVKINGNLLTMNKKNEDKGFIIYEGETNVEPNDKISVSIEMEQIFNDDYIYECHTTNHPLTDLFIHVTKPKNYKFDLTHQLSSKLEMTTETDELVIYKTNGAVYKGQNIEFYAEKIENIT